jgi:hypothetical protein
MSESWPAGVPESLSNYRIRQISDLPEVPMMGVHFASGFLYAFAFGCVFVLFFAWGRFQRKSGDGVGFGYRVMSEIPVAQLGGAGALRRAYLIYAGTLVVIYIAMTFFGKLILEAVNTLPMVGVQVDTSSLKFDSPQWPLTLAFALAGLAPMLPPLELAEDWLRHRAYRAVGIPVRIQQTTRSLIETLDECARRHDLEGKKESGDGEPRQQGEQGKSEQGEQGQSGKPAKGK